MQRLSFFLLLTGLAVSGQPLTDQALREQASSLAKAAAGEPPLMAMDTLVRLAAVIKPYAPVESKRVLEQAVRHASLHRDQTFGSTTVRHWMDLDPVNAEKELRKFRDQRHYVAALSSYYQQRNEAEQAAKLAAEALMLAQLPGSSNPFFSNSGLLRLVAVHSPLRLPELLRLPHIAADPQFGSTLLSAIEGLMAAAPIDPQSVLKAATSLDPLIERTDFEKGATELLIVTTKIEGKPVSTTDTKSTLRESLALARSLANPETRAAAQQTLRTRSTTFKRVGAPPQSRPPVDGQLPLSQAIEEIEKREPAYQRMGELWRYLQAKPREAAEAKPILETLIAWAGKAEDSRSDPARFLHSLLNLDGRLGPPGRQWVLAKELRPMVFRAAASVYQSQDRRPDQLHDLILAMISEGVSVPAELRSARNRIDIEMLRRGLEVRYDFTLPTPNNNLTVRLQNYRGKVVLLNFWATWCAPCRAELPALAALAKEFREQLAVVAITDEPSSTVTDFLEKNPVGVRVLVDRPRDTFRHYNVNGLPQTFLIGPDGVLRKHFKAEVSETDLRAAVQEALAAKIPRD